MARYDQWYNVAEEQWPDLKSGRIVLMPVRIGVDRRTGKMLVGWSHVLQSILVIFSTRFHERVLRRWVGSFVPHLLGESAVQHSVMRFYWAIASALDLWEPNYRLQRIRIGKRADETNLTGVEALRMGKIVTQHEGTYRPRAHLGDDTAEVRRSFSLAGRGAGVWDRAA